MGKTVSVGRALLSVFDKSGMADFAKGLSEAGVELVSTGGTHRLISEAGLPVRDISDLTGFPEMMDGRVKTLHPKVHGGLLSVRDNAEHRAAMDAHEIGPIDLVAVNLYPFEKTVASGASYDEIIENIDIGGPAMIRAAEALYEYPMVDRDPLPYWTQGRATLLGDAAHAMYPIGSNGASQAILDARVLTREILAQGATPKALAAYEAERRPATAKIVLANRQNGPEQVMQRVEELAPNGFRHIEDVLTPGELEETAANYKKLAGFDKEALNSRPSIVEPSPAAT